MKTGNKTWYKSGYLFFKLADWVCPVKLNSEWKWCLKNVHHFLDLIQSEDVHQHIPLTTAEHGRTVTLQCVISEKDRMLYWYKQSIGHMPQRVADKTKFQETSSVSGERISAKMVGSNYVLNIKNITSSDEGIYFCQTGTQFGMNFRNGTLVTLRGTYPTVDRCLTIL